MNPAPQPARASTGAPARAPARGRLRRQWLAAALTFLALGILHGGWPLLAGRVAPGENFQNLPNCAFSWFCLRDGVLPLWNPYIFSGMPHLASHHACALYPPVYLFFGLMAPFRAFGLMQEFHYVLMGLGAWAWLRFGWRLRHWPALAGGVFFMLSGFTVAHEPHAPMIWAIAWIPWLLWLSRRTLAGRPWAGPALAAVMAIQVGAGYMQITAMTCAIMGLEALTLGARGPWRSALRRFVLWGAAMAIGMGLMSVQFLSTWELLPLTGRGSLPYDNFTSHGFPLAQLPTLFFPCLLGVSQPFFYWNGLKHPFFMVNQLDFGFWDQPEMICSMGAAAWVGLLLLAFRGGAGRGEPRLSRPGLRRPIIFWACVAIFCLLLLPGEISLMNRLLYRVPVFNLFRVQNRWMVFASLAAAALAAAGLDRLLGLIERGRKPRLGRPLAAGAVALAAAAPLAWVLIRLTRDQGLLRVDWDWFFRDWFRLANPAVWTPLAFGLAALAALALVWRRPGMWKTGLILWIGLYAIEQKLLCMQMVLRVNWPVEWHTPPGNEAADWMMRQNGGRAEDFRALTPTGDDICQTEETMPLLMAQLNGIYAVGGYWPFMPPLYGRLIKMESIGISLDALGLLGRPAILNMLNVKYILVGHWFEGWWPIDYRPDLPTPKLLAEIERPGRFPWLRRAHITRRGVTIIENAGALPRAWLVRKIIPSQSPDGAVDWLWSAAGAAFNPAREALVELWPTDPAPLKMDDLSTGTVEFVQRKFDRMRIKVNAPAGPGFLVISEAWYPGWWARVNGKLTPIRRVNGVLRGVEVPRGQSEVYLRYLPEGFMRGLKLSLAFALVWAVWCGLLVARGRGRRRRKSTP